MAADMAGWRAGFRDENGNVAMMYALMAPILVFASGAAIDYGRSAGIQSELNAAADGAALAALTPAMMQQSAATAQQAAESMFQGLTANISGISGTTVSASVTTGATALVRNVTVTYSTSATTLFGAAVGKSTLPISGSSSASAQVPPNIDFYVLLDNSPSMALPATTAGITQMQTLTNKQASGAGCAFACHQSSTGNSDTEGNLCLLTTTNIATKVSSTSYVAPGSNGYCTAPTNTKTTTYTSTQLDDYAVARYNSIPLRLDELNSGMTTLLETATTTAQSSPYATPPQYRFAIYSMDSLWQIGLTQQVALTTGYQSAWTAASANFGVMEMYSNNNDCANSACSSSTTTPGGDVATSYDDSLGKLSQTSYIPNPGNGTNQPGDTPQKVLFIVTDGVEDELSGGNRLQQTINDLGAAPGGKSGGTNWCTTIKNRGIKIAILYTDYLAVPANSWYVDYIQPIQTDIGPALKACASPNLYADAAIGSDLGAALTNLFTLATQTEHLTQ